MIEAVKSTVANSALLRASVDQSSTLNSFAANPEKIQQVSQAPYVSPTVRVDVNTKIAILEFRESVSGEVLAQIPSEQAIRTYKLREAKEDAEIAAKLTKRPTNTVQKDSFVSTTTSAPAQRVQESAPAPSSEPTFSNTTPALSEAQLSLEVSEIVA